MANDPVQDWHIKLTPGMNNKSDEQDLEGKYVKLAQNLRYESEPGAVSKRPPLAYYNSTAIAGTTSMLGAYRLYGAGGTKVLAAYGSGIYVGDDTAGTLTSIKTLSTSGNRMSFVTYKGLAICGNGQDPLLCYDGSSDNVMWELGSLKVKIGSSAGITRTAISYKVGIVVSGTENLCDAVSNEIATLTNQSVDLLYIPLGPAGTTSRKIYRKSSETGGAWKLVMTIADNSTINLTGALGDTTADASGGAAIGTATNAMPKGNILKIHKERLFVSGDPNNRNYIYYSNSYLPHFIQQTSNLDFMKVAPDDGDQIMGLGIQVGTMLIIKRNTIRKASIASNASSASPTSWYAEDPFIFLGTPAQWSICETAAGTIFLGNDGWYNFNGGSLERIIDEFDTAKILPSLYSNVICHYSAGILYASYADIEEGTQYNNKIMVYDFIRNKFSVDTINAGCFMSQSGSGDNNELLIGDSKLGHLYRISESEYSYKLSTKIQANAGASSGVSVGGSDNSPTISLGSTITATAIPNDICIFWDNETTTPGAGWTEISMVDKFFYIDNSGTPGVENVTGASHTHTLAGTLTSVSPTQVNNGNTGTSCTPFPHTHTFSGSVDASTPVPRHIKYRVFKKNATTTEYQFPIGSILMWDQASAPAGWLALDDPGYYIRNGLTDLGIPNSSSHSHTYAISSSVADPTGGLAGADSNAASEYNHVHSVNGTTESSNNNTWELDYVAFRMIKRIGEEDLWDGQPHFIYALYYSASTPGNDWTDVTATYTGRWLKTGDSVISTGSRANYAHTHTVYNGTTQTNTQLTGDGGTGARGVQAHTHPYVVPTGLTGSSDLSNPSSISFHLCKKILGRMQNYNSAISLSYTTVDTCDNSAAWSDGSGGDVTLATETTIKKEGTGSVKMTVAAGAGVELLAYNTFSAMDWADTSSSTQLLLHLDGIDGSSTITDSSSSPNTVTSNGVVIDTAKYKFGGAAGYWNGTTAYLSIPDSANWAFGTGDFTIDFWVNFEVSGVGHTFFSQYVSSSEYTRFHLNNGTTLTFTHESGGNTISLTGAWVPVLDTWYHVALVRNGTAFTLYVDGAVLATATDADTIADLATALEIGRFGSTAPTNSFRGWIDEYRVMKGTALWTAAFTPPSSPYTTADTGYLNVGFWFYSTVALDAGDLQFLIDNTAACASPLETLNLPAIVASTWTYVNLTPTSPSGLTGIVSVGIKQAVDKGAMVLYIDDIIVGYKNGTWTSPAINIKAKTLNKIYWNATFGSLDTVTLYTRVGATQSACEAAAWDTGVTISGSAITSAANEWIQYKINLTAADVVASNPTVYVSGDYAVKFTYVKTGTPAETAVSFRYKFGAINFNSPMTDKIFKSIVSNHSGSAGEMHITWTTDVEETGTFTIDLSANPKRWQSFFQDNAFGKTIDVEFSKNDLNDLTIKELQGLYSPQPTIL